MSGSDVTVVAIFRIPAGCFVDMGGSSGVSLPAEGGKSESPMGHVKIPPNGADAVLDFTTPGLHLLRKDDGSDAIKDRFDMTSMLEIVMAISNIKFSEAVFAANHKAEARLPNKKPSTESKQPA